MYAFTRDGAVRTAVWSTRTVFFFRFNLYGNRGRDTCSIDTRCLNDAQRRILIGHGKEFQKNSIPPI